MFNFFESKNETTDFVTGNRFNSNMLIKTNVQFFRSKKKKTSLYFDKQSASAANNVGSDHNKELYDLTTVNIVGSVRGGKTTQDLHEEEVY